MNSAVNEKIPVSFSRVWLRTYPYETIFCPVVIKIAGEEETVQLVWVTL